MKIAEVLCCIFGESVKLYKCTENLNLGQRPDAIVEAGDRKYALRAKLSLTSGVFLDSCLKRRRKQKLQNAT